MIANSNTTIDNGLYSIIIRSMNEYCNVKNVDINNVLYQILSTALETELIT